MVEFYNLRAVNARKKDELMAAFERVLTKGQFILGPEVEKFEEEFANFVGAQFCIGVGNGLDALEISLLSLGVGEGDEVIVPANTFIATWIAVHNIGAVPVPVEPDARSYNIDTDKIERAITGKTKAIMPVHLFGNPCDMRAIKRVADAHGVFIIDDAAQAHGAVVFDEKIGSTISAASCFSFYPGKNLGALGDGGAITTSDPELVKNAAMLRNYGQKKKYENIICGRNSRLDELQAAFLRVKLRDLEALNSRRNEIANRYTEGLNGLPLQLPVVSKWAKSAWHQYVICVEDRDPLIAALGAKGVPTMIHYPVPPHLAPAFASLGYGPGDFPVTELLASRILSLPIDPTLGDDDIDFIVDVVKQNV